MKKFFLWTGILCFLDLPLPTRSEFNEEKDCLWFILGPQHIEPRMNKQQLCEQIKAYLYTSMSKVGNGLLERKFEQIKKHSY